MLVPVPFVIALMTVEVLPFASAGGGHDVTARRLVWRASPDEGRYPKGGGVLARLFEAGEHARMISSAAALENVTRWAPHPGG
jgi:hypothetical protein